MSAPERSREELVAIVVERADHVIAACSRLAADPNLSMVENVDANISTLSFWTHELRTRVLQDSD